MCRILYVVIPIKEELSELAGVIRLNFVRFLTILLIPLVISALEISLVALFPIELIYFGILLFLPFRSVLSTFRYAPINL